jgi:hypothetical protein
MVFSVFEHHPRLFHPLDGTPGEGHAAPDPYHSQRDWMLAVDPEFVDRMLKGLQDGWQDQLPGGVDRVWLVKPADESSRRREAKIEFVVILGQDDYPVRLYRLMNPTRLRRPRAGPTPEHVLHEHRHRRWRVW